MKGKRILIIIDQVNIGGAARVNSLLMEYLVEAGYDVILATDTANCGSFYPVHPKVKQVPFLAKYNGLPFLKQIRLILSAKKIIRETKPNVIIAVTFAPFFYAYFATFGKGIPVIAYDHTSFTRKMGIFADFIRYHLYKKADHLVLLTHKDSNIIHNRFPRNTVIYNPLTYSINRDAKHCEKAVLCAGRLDDWDVKGFDRIIRMWKNIKEEFPDWRLVIAGGGSDCAKAQLTSLAEEFGIGGCVEFLGQVADMPSIYERFPIFALPSRVEGFPMVLLEAMSQGCVCVSFEMGGAIREMTEESASLIVPDNDELMFADKLRAAMKKYPDYKKEQEKGWSYCSKFSRESFNMDWDNLLKEIL